jgi:hypothetical protein
VRSHHSESEASSSNGSPRHDPERSKTEVARYPSQGVTGIAPRLFAFELHINGKPDVTPRAPVDTWDDFGRSQHSWYGPTRNDDAVTFSGSGTQHQMVECSDDNFSSPSHELVRVI